MHFELYWSYLMVFLVYFGLYFKLSLEISDNFGISQTMSAYSALTRSILGLSLPLSVYKSNSLILFYLCVYLFYIRLFWHISVFFCLSWVIPGYLKFSLAILAYCRISFYLVLSWSFSIDRVLYSSILGFFGQSWATLGFLGLLLSETYWLLLFT